MCCIARLLDQCHDLLYSMWRYDTNEAMRRGWLINPSFAAAVEDGMPLMCIGNMRKIQGVCYDAVACWVNAADADVDADAALPSYLCWKTIKAIYTSCLWSTHFYCYRVAISIVPAEVAWVKTMWMMFL